MDAADFVVYSRVMMLTMNQVSGTVWFRNATIETCGEAEISRGTYFLVNKKMTNGRVLKLK